jgi:hypothetical protein
VTVSPSFSDVHLRIGESVIAKSEATTQSISRLAELSIASLRWQ